LLLRASFLTTVLGLSACTPPASWTPPREPLVPLAESPSRGEGFTFCAAPPKESKVHLGNALWLSFFAANEYAHGSFFAPMLNHLGFYNPAHPQDRAWAACLDDLGRLREVEQAREAELLSRGGAGQALTLSLLPADGSWGTCLRELSGRATFVDGGLPSGALTEALVHRADEGAYLQFISGRAAGEKRRFRDGSTQLVFARHKDLPVAIIAFRGTEPKQAADVALDLTAWRTKLEKHGWPAGWGSVHAGFHDGFLEVEPILLAKVRELSGTKVRLWVTGHSLGAALATLTVARLLRAREEGARIELGGLYAFGSPRVGDREFTEALAAHAAEQGVPLVRVRNENDAVTAIPGVTFGYTHVGTLLHLREGALLVAPEPEPGYATLSIADHNSAGWFEGRAISGYYRRLQVARASGAYAALDRCPR
jgi:hypothetical protein